MCSAHLDLGLISAYCNSIAIYGTGTQYLQLALTKVSFVVPQYCPPLVAIAATVTHTKKL
jgi:hypothetical protein